MQKWPQSVIIVVFQLHNSVFSGVHDFHRESVFFLSHSMHLGEGLPGNWNPWPKCAQGHTT